MVVEWGTIILSAIVSLLSAGGIGWIVTAKEDKKAKDLENKKKEVELEEYKKDEIIKDWKEIAEERKHRAEELALDVKEYKKREDEKDAQISDLKAHLDEKNTYCAVAELMRCDEISCPNRRPPFGMRETKVKDNFE